LIKKRFGKISHWLQASKL